MGNIRYKINKMNKKERKKCNADTEYYYITRK